MELRQHRAKRWVFFLHILQKIPQREAHIHGQAVKFGPARCLSAGLKGKIARRRARLHHGARGGWGWGLVGVLDGEPSFAQRVRRTLGRMTLSGTSKSSRVKSPDLDQPSRVLLSSRVQVLVDLRGSPRLTPSAFVTASDVSGTEPPGVARPLRLSSVWLSVS